MAALPLHTFVAPGFNMQLPLLHGSWRCSYRGLYHSYIQTYGTFYHSYTIVIPIQLISIRHHPTAPSGLQPLRGRLRFLKGFGLGNPLKVELEPHLQYIYLSIDLSICQSIYISLSVYLSHLISSYLILSISIYHHLCIYNRHASIYAFFSRLTTYLRQERQA